MKNLALLSILFLAPKIFALPVQTYTCHDANSEWNVKAKLSSDSSNFKGTLNASYQGWQVISTNLDKSMPQHVGGLYSSNSGITFGTDLMGSSAYLKAPGHDQVALSCEIEYQDEVAGTCEVKSCGPNGPTYHTIEVPAGYQCVPYNIHCKN